MVALPGAVAEDEAEAGSVAAAGDGVVEAAVIEGVAAEEGCAEAAVIVGGVAHGVLSDSRPQNSAQCAQSEENTKKINTLLSVSFGYRARRADWIG